MIKANTNILDVSYSIVGKVITIQVVLLEGTNLSDDVVKKVTDNLSEYEVRINALYLSKDKFNENKGDWQPKYYNWIGHLLFSKAEVL